jgi:UDP-glucuronate 4-epimerase
MKILITGGAGFIGSHVTERLLDLEHEIVCIDSFNDFYDPAIKRHNVEQALLRRNYSLVVGDILDKVLLNRVFSMRFDAVIHLAAYAGVRPSIERPDVYQQVNIEGTVNLLEQCRLNEVPKFVFASSSSVYGGRTEVPFRETDNVMRPISPYAATKVAGETLCYTYHHLFDTNILALRFFTVYGPRQRPEMAIHRFARRLTQGDEIPMYGDGRSARDYTYVDDIADGVVKAVDYCNGYQVINLGGSQTTTLIELIELIGKRLGVTPKIKQLPNQPGDDPITYADVTCANKLLGYRPRIDIEEGIDRFCAWYEEHRDSEVWGKPALPSLTPSTS